MADNYWLGTKDGEGQIDLIEVTAYDASTEYRVTINGVTVAVDGDTDIATTTDNLAAALEASDNPYFSAISWVSDTVSEITCTSVTLGMPFTVTTSVSGGTGTISHTAEDTAATGPNFWSEDENWSTGTAPANGDDVIIENSNINIRWGLAQSAVTLDSLKIRKSYTGKIGLKRFEVATSADGDSTDDTQEEYRDIYLEIGTDILNIGENFSGVAQEGSTLIKIDMGTNATLVNVFDTATSSDETNKPAVQLLAVNVATEIFVRKAPGSIGIAAGIPFEVSTVERIEIGDEMTTGGVIVECGTTIDTFTCKSGTHWLCAAATVATLTVDGGTVNLEGDYTITAATAANNGLINANHIKTAGVAITTLNIELDGEVNTLGNSEPRTFTTVNFNVGATLRADKDILTITTFEEPSGQYALTTET